MLQKIMTYVSQTNMIRKGDRIVAGVSGGADSVCLFYVLLELKKRMAIELSVVHVNHGLRLDAGQDEAYVERICKEQGVAFYPVHADVRREAAKQGIGEEEAGRRIRYAAFERILKEAFGGDGKIAVAHNRDDRAETVLFHLFRGTGLSGLTGIAPVRDRIIRPLLCVSREEIENWLAEKQIGYCTDSTNGTDAYARNRIRHHILPYAENEICNGASEHINKTADLLGQAAEYLDRQTQAAFSEAVVLQENSVRLSLEKWNALDRYLKQSVVHEAFKRLTAGAKDVGAVHVEQLCGLFAKQVGRRLDLPGGLRAVRNYEGVLLMKEAPETGGGKGLEEPSGAERNRREPSEAGRNRGDSSGAENGRIRRETDSPEGAENRQETDMEAVYVPVSGDEGRTAFGDYEIYWRIFENQRGDEVLADIPKNDFTKWFDYDKIRTPICFRYRKPGDAITVNDQGGSKKIREFMIDEKISSEKRSRIPLLAEGNRILWIVGYRIGQYYKISSQTKKIIEIRISGGKQNG